MRSSRWIRNLAVIPLSFGMTVAATAKDIVHDAEFYVLEAQHGKKWSQQDQALDAKLEVLRKKYGRPGARKRFQFSKR